MSAQPMVSAQMIYEHWLRTPNDMRSHLPLLRACALDLSVELGCSQGVSTAALLAGAEEAGAEALVVSVSTDDVAHLFEGHPQWRFFRGDSADPKTLTAFRAAIPDRRISTLLLDSRHTYEHVLAELRLWGPMVREGGIVLVHDIVYAPGVRRAVEEYVAKTGWSAVFLLPDNGLAVLVARHGH